MRQAEPQPQKPLTGLCRYPQIVNNHFQYCRNLRLAHRMIFRQPVSSRRWAVGR